MAKEKQKPDSYKELYGLLQKTFGFDMPVDITFVEWSIFSGKTHFGAGCDSEGVMADMTTLGYARTEDNKDIPRRYFLIEQKEETTDNLKKRKIMRCGLSLVHDVLRTRIGYGRMFDSDNFSDVISTSSGVHLAPGCTLDNLLEDLDKGSYVKSFVENGKKNYLLVRADTRQDPVLGFNRYKTKI